MPGVALALSVVVSGAVYVALLRGAVIVTVGGTTANTLLRESAALIGHVTTTTFERLP